MTKHRSDKVTVDVGEVYPALVNCWVPGCGGHSERGTHEGARRIAEAVGLTLDDLCDWNFTASAQANREAASAGWMSEPKSQGTSSRPSAGAKPVRQPAPLPSQAKVQGWHRRLMDDDERRDWLTQERGLLVATLAKFEIGWNGDKNCYTIPVRNTAGELVNLRTYNPDALPKQRKKGLAGRPTNLFPLGEPLRTSWVLLCEGEWDCLLARQHGLPAYTTTGGAGTWKPEWSEFLAGRHVAFVYDCDTAGRTGAGRVAADLDEIAESVKVVDLGLPGDSADLTDWFTIHGRTKQQLWTLIKSTPLWGVSETGTTTTWAPQDVGAVVRGEVTESPPTMLERLDDASLLYAGKVHAINSEPEAGKTWLALMACAERIGVGEHVVYLDFEDTAVGVVGRMLAFGLPPDRVAAQFHYVRPDEPLTEDAERDLFGAMASFLPSLVVLDGITEAMALQGLSITNNDDAAEFMKLLPRPLAATGAAVVVLDHVTKDREQQGKYAIGAQHKLAGIDGAVYRLTVKAPLGRGLEGESWITVMKDRPGFVRAASPNSRTGLFILVGRDDGTVAACIEPPGTSPPPLNARVDQDVLRRVSEFVEAADRPIHTQEIKDGVEGRAKTVVDALEWLTENGYLDRDDRGRGRATFYTSQRLFTGEGT